MAGAMYERYSSSRGDAAVGFPLRGEWWAVHTPAHRVPSHGTDFFAQRYAFDFARMDPSGDLVLSGWDRGPSTPRHGRPASQAVLLLGPGSIRHLHFHLMDGPDPLSAGPVPCAFRDYEEWADGSWRLVDRGIPGRFERIRSAGGHHDG